MQYKLSSCILCSVALSASLFAQVNATFGEVISLGGTPSDIVLDESRQRLYLVNPSANRVDVWDYAAKALIGSIDVGLNPLAAAMSMDNVFLYVSNHDSSSLSVIDLTSAIGSVNSTVSLPAKPEGVEVGFDGRVLISTDGTGVNNLSSTLLLFDRLQSGSSQVIAVQFPPPPPTPAAIPLLFARPTTPFNGKLKRTPDGKYIIGVSSITNNTSTVVYVFEAISGTLLQSRTVVGQSSTLSVAPDGATFTAGFTLYNTSTLNVVAQQNTLNAPFTMTGTFSTTANVGGSTFSPDGATLYSVFNSSAANQPPTLLISDARNLAIHLGIKLPENIIAKMVMTSDGADAWGLSDSGVLHLPLSTLFNYPILMPQSTTVFLAQDPCNPGVAQATLKIDNIGSGTATFAVPQTVSGGSAALIATANSGLAPANIVFTMDPGRSGVIRDPGTNLYTGGGSNNLGAAVNINLVSPTAINIPNTIRVFMNYRDSGMRGVIYPIPTVPNSTAANNEGLQDIVLDESRNRVYVTNSGYNRIEVFDTQNMKFLDPIPVGQLPHQMAMGLDGTTLYVTNVGGESIATVDLDQQLLTGLIQFPPIPRAGNAAVNAVRTMAMGLSGLQFVMTLPSNNTGTLWKVIGNQAVPRVGNAVTGVSAQGAQTPLTAPTQTMLASPDGSSIGLLAGNGTAYLYDALSDSYTSAHALFPAPIIGYYGPLGSSPSAKYLLANGLVMNKSLTAIGGAASPGTLTITPPTAPGQPATISVTSTGLRNVAAVAPVDDTKFVRMTTIVRNNLTATVTDDKHTTLELVNTATGAQSVAALMPENPTLSEFGTTRIAMPPRQMVVDSQGTVYALTLSGLSVVPLTATTAPQIPAGARGIINATDGTTTFRPGSFITINGTNLASLATADTLPPPTVLGGSCVVFDDVAMPLLQTAGGQISAQIPATIRPGTGVLQVRSLANAQKSAPLVVTIQKP